MVRDPDHTCPESGSAWPRFFKRQQPILFTELQEMSIARLSTLFTGAVLLATLAGCSWVDVKPQGEKVRVLTSQEVGRCRFLGHVTSNTAATLLVFVRGRAKVQEEVNTLARNEAGTMGADTVVPTGPLIEGEQTFNVYRCINP